MGGSHAPSFQGYKGIMCAECDRNYYVSVDNQCRYCNVGGEDHMAEAKVVYSIGSMAGFAMVSLALLLYLQPPGSDGVIVKCLNNFGFCKKTKEEREHDARAPPRFPISAEKFKIFLVFFQIFSTFESSQIVVWPTMLKFYMTRFNVTSLDLLYVVLCVIDITMFI